MNRQTLKKSILIIVGLLAVGLGIVGVFVPLLPTTPFLLLAAACFLRSSPFLYDWLMQHKWFGAYIRNYHEQRAMTLRAKIGVLSLLWLAIGYSAIFAVDLWWLRLLLMVIAVGVSTHILSLNTYKGK
jgi:uncharacterized membrane protein YbaN (DUF454 family)